MITVLRPFIACVYVIWLRDLRKFFRERTRVIAMFGQPLLYLAIMGQGLRSLVALDVPGFDYLSFMYPGIIGMTILFSAMSSSVSIIWDREFGMLKEVLVAPVPRAAIAAGKALGSSSTSVMQGAVLLLLAPLVGLSVGLTAAALMLPLMFLLAFAIASLGTLVAARSETMESFHIIMNFITIPLFMLSGAFFPIASAPEWMQPLMKANPVAYGVDAFRNIFFAESPARDFIVYYPLSYDVLVLALFSIISVTLGMLAFHKSD